MIFFLLYGYKNAEKTKSNINEDSEIEQVLEMPKLRSRDKQMQK